MEKIRTLRFDKREIFLNLRASSMTMSKIASIVKCSKSTVKRTINKVNESESYLKKKAGRKPILTPSDDNCLKICSKRDRRKTLPEIAYEFNLSRKIKVGYSTIRRSLLRSQLSGKVAAKKPSLRKPNFGKRLKFAKEHIDWTHEQWDRVLFSDESKFELFGCKRRVFVRRMPNERFKKYCIAGTVKRGGGSVNSSDYLKQMLEGFPQEDKDVFDHLSDLEKLRLNDETKVWATGVKDRNAAAYKQVKGNLFKFTI